MIQVPDAPYIREAEMYGVGYQKPTEQDYRSKQYQETIVSELKKVRNLIQMAVGLLEGLPDETVWEDRIADIADSLADIGFTVDNTADEIERW